MPALLRLGRQRQRLQVVRAVAELLVGVRGELLEQRDRRLRTIAELVADRGVEQREALCAVVAELPPAATVDVACGTGFLTQHLRGPVTGLDQSERMLAIARRRRPDGRFVTGDALALPFADGEFGRVLTGHFYGHLEAEHRGRFLAEARRVAPELVVIHPLNTAWTCHRCGGTGDLLMMEHPGPACLRCRAPSSAGVETLVTMTFEEKGGKTVQTFHQRPFLNAEPRQPRGRLDLVLRQACGLCRADRKGAQRMITISAFKWVPEFAYGQVRDLRARWALEEAGIPYKTRLLEQGDQDKPDYRALQPFGQVPILQDGDFTLFESGAIVLYIGERTETLLPKDPVARAHATQWLIAALNSIEPSLMNVALIDLFYSNEE